MSSFIIKELSKEDSFDKAILFCNNCHAQLEIIAKQGYRFYINPGFDSSWLLEWHKYYNVRIICPELIKDVLKSLDSLECPSCYQTAIISIKNRMFDANILLQSMRSKKISGYTCSHCRVTYTKFESVLELEDKQFICSACLNDFQEQRCQDTA